MRWWVLAGLALGGCASDVVLKPAVVRFVGDSAVASAAVNRGYDALVADANRNAALMLAANPECGMNTRVPARAANPELAAVLARPGAQAAADALAASERVAKRRVPGESYCVSAFETRVAERLVGRAAFADLPVRTVPLLLLDGSEFETQRAAVTAVADYVAALAEVADAPEMRVEADIAAAAGVLRAVGTQAAAMAETLRVAKAGAGAGAAALMADDGPVAGYAGAVGALAGNIERIVKEGRDVRALRGLLLAPDNGIEAQIRAVGAEADRWHGQRVVFAQGAAMSAKAGVAGELAALPFGERVALLQAFVDGAAAVRRPARSPYGAMMGVLADAHADLRRIAREEYTDAERRAVVQATLERVGATLKAVAGVLAP